MLTVEPLATWASGFGFWTSTAPAGMSLLNLAVPWWSRRRNSASVLVAWSRGMLTRFGTVLGAGPDDTTRATSVSGSTSPPAVSAGCAGTDHEITEPAGTSS